MSPETIASRVVDEPLMFVLSVTFPPLAMMNCLTIFERTIDSVKSFEPTMTLTPLREVPAALAADVVAADVVAVVVVAAAAAASFDQIVAIVVGQIHLELVVEQSHRNFDVF